MLRSKSALGVVGNDTFGFDSEHIMGDMRSDIKRALLVAAFPATYALLAWLLGYRERAAEALETGAIALAVALLFAWGSWRGE
jgi:hypothetical protein